MRTCSAGYTVIRPWRPKPPKHPLDECQAGVTWPIDVTPARMRAVDCSGTGSALGLNDLIHCIALEENATPVDVLPAFGSAGAASLDIDHLHPSDAGHLAIAKAFGRWAFIAGGSIGGASTHMAC
jgi:hypothetical protein